MMCGKDTLSFASSLSSNDIFCFKACTWESVGIFSFRRECLRFATNNLSNFDEISSVISGNIGRIKRVDRSLCHELSLCDIRVVIGVETRRALSWLMSELSRCTLNVINLHSFSQSIFNDLVFLRSSSIDIVDFHLVSHVSGRSNRSLFYLRQLILRLKGISTEPGS